MTYLSTEQRKKIVGWVRLARKRMGLEQYSLTLDWEENRKAGPLMEIEMNFDYNAGKVTVHERVIKEYWQKYGDEEIEFVPV